jgi:hypothetical protein
MPDNNDFTFTLSVSEQNFTTKPPKGDDAWCHIRFKPQEFTVSTFLDAALDGKVFCGTFKSDNADSSFPIGDKRRENFISTSTIFYDFDNMDMEMGDFISDKVKYKPTFAYTTYDNGIEGNRFRLGYVFIHPIKGEANFNAMYDAIIKANGFPIESKEQGGVDKSTTDRCEQCYLGTHQGASTYYTPYSLYTYSRLDFEEFIEETPVQLQPQASGTDKEIKIDSGFLNDFLNLNTDDFFHKYRYYYDKYKKSLETELILDDSGMFYTFPEFYVAVTHKIIRGKTYRWQIGDDRKNKIFVAAKIMLYNVPSLTIENLLFNLRMERHWYYVNTDGKIDDARLIQTAKNAFKYDLKLNPTKHRAYKVNKEYWKKQGISANSAKGYVRSYMHAMEIKPYINPYMSLKYNLDLLEENGITISESTLKRMVNRGFIEVNKNMEYSFNNTYLSERHTNATIRVTNEIIRLLKENGNTTQKDLAEILGMDIRTIKGYFKRMKKEKLIKLVGNNRSGKWVVIEPQPQEPNVIEPELVSNQITLCQEAFV